MPRLKKRRSNIERRRFNYAACIPELRKSQERRKNSDRRKGQRYILERRTSLAIGQQIAV